MSSKVVWKFSEQNIDNDLVSDPDLDEADYEQYFAGYKAGWDEVVKRYVWIEDSKGVRDEGSFVICAKDDTP